MPFLDHFGESEEVILVEGVFRRCEEVELFRQRDRGVQDVVVCWDQCLFFRGFEFALVILGREGADVWSSRERFELVLVLTAWPLASIEL